MDGIQGLLHSTSELQLQAYLIFLINIDTILTPEGLLDVANVAKLAINRINYSVILLEGGYLRYRLSHKDPVF